VTGVAAFVAAASIASAPIVGVNYDWYAITNCQSHAGGVISDGDVGQTRIRRQLAAMHAAGIRKLRTFIWNMHDAGGQLWGVVSSAGGTLTPTAHENLIAYLRDVRAAGFEQLEIVFGPEWTNDPIGYPENHWDPAMFDENWNLIRSVRRIVKEYGPPITTFDLINEGAPSSYLATTQQLVDYDARIYANYVDAFGNADVTISSIIDSGDAGRLGNLVDALRSTGRPLPRWFEIHSYTPTLLQDLQAVDATLTAKGLTQPIALAETYYDDAANAAGIRQVVASSTRPLLEVSEWPIRRDNPSCGLRAPYRADAYLGSPPALTVSVPRGGRATTLVAGTYVVTVRDRSRTAGFRLRGHATGVRFVGTVHWKVTLPAGTYPGLVVLPSP
jgi:hypothetical protein